MIHEILMEINESNKTNHKLMVLKKYDDDIILKRICELAYDRVRFTYGITMKNVHYIPEKNIEKLNMTLETILNFLEIEFAEGFYTGNDAISRLTSILESTTKENAELIEKIIGRDLKIGVGKTQINKVWKDLITKPAYMRCGVYSEKTAKKISFPALLQIKADGTYREFTKTNKNISAISRSGEDYDYDNIFKKMKNYSDGHYTGELTVRCDDEIARNLTIKMEKLRKKGDDTEAIEIALANYEIAKSKIEHYILPRAIGNGLINSDDVPYDNLIVEFWDFISHDEYANAKARVKNGCKIKYKDRFNELKKIVNETPDDQIQVIESVQVKSIPEALAMVSSWMKLGLEGGVLKDMNSLFKDGTNLEQLKLKIKIDTEMRIKAFNPGRKGTKREGKVGSLIFENDEGTIKGKCSGFNDVQLDDFTNNPDKYMDKVFTCQCNDLSKAAGNDHYALSHPRFIEIRTDKNETDTLEKVKELRALALLLLDVNI